MSNGFAAAEKVVEEVAKVEPTAATVASMVIPGAAPIIATIQPFLLPAIPFIENALTALAQANGGNMLMAVLELIQHVTPGQPNSPVLTAPPVTAAPRPDVPA